MCEAKRGRLIREGARVAIGGKPNVGKSSLFNALLRAGRAIVTPIPGTTRDLVTETADVDGLRLELVDTAGVRETTDEVESEGVARARRAWTTADLVLVVLDVSAPLEDDDFNLLRETSDTPRLIVANKSDLPAAWRGADVAVPIVSRVVEDGRRPRRASRRDSRGARGRESRDRARHGGGDQRAARGACSSARAWRCGAPVTPWKQPGGPVAEEFVLTDLQDARAALEEVTGKRTSEDLLRHIFSRFCIGK